MRVYEKREGGREGKQGELGREEVQGRRSRYVILFASISNRAKRERDEGRAEEREEMKKKEQEDECGVIMAGCQLLNRRY